MAERVALTINAQPVEVPADCSVAAAVMQSHGIALRHSVTGQARGPLCGMGVCFECRLTVDGCLHQRSCLLPSRDGMNVVSEPEAQVGDIAQPRALASGSERMQEFDVMVIGAGPAGIAAACCAAEARSRVALVDDSPRVGGQIWRHDRTKAVPRDTARWITRLGQTAVERFSQTQIIAALDSTTLLAETPNGSMGLRFRRLILACGARERFLPFPGWTLPGVFGAGGLQALVKSGYAVRGKKVIVAGSGPLLLAVAAYLRSQGAHVLYVAEQSPRGKLLRFGGALLWHQSRKMLDALALRWQLRGVPYRPGCWVTRADGADRVASVTFTDGTRTWSESCDALACGFGLVPNLEAPMLLGCTVERGFVKVDQHQQTSVPGVYAVGELTGIGGLDKALVEGQIAGWAAAGQPERSRGLLAGQASATRFVQMLDDAFALRDELRQLADDATIVCRCEDIPYQALKRFANWSDAKLQTRCGMGPCQGRICGAPVQFLFGWVNDSVRPPLFPTALRNLS